MTHRGKSHWIEAYHAFNALYIQFARFLHLYSSSTQDGGFLVASVWLWGQGNAGLVKFIWKCPFSTFLEEFRMFIAAFFIIAKTWKQQADEKNRYILTQWNIIQP